MSTEMLSKKYSFPLSGRYILIQLNLGLYLVFSEVLSQYWFIWLRNQIKPLGIYHAERFQIKY